MITRRKRRKFSFLNAFEKRRVERHPEPAFVGNPGWPDRARSLPAPSDIPPDRPDHRSEAIDSRALVADPRPAPTRSRPARTHRPSKAEYIRSFAASGPLPMCVRATRARAFIFVHNVERRLGALDSAQPRRLRKALAAYRFDDLACAYDPGMLARIGHHADAHERRVFRARMREMRECGRDGSASAVREFRDRVGLCRVPRVTSPRLPAHTA